MSTFEFTALIQFLQMLFDAFAKFLETLGINFDFGGEDAADEETTA